MSEVAVLPASDSDSESKRKHLAVQENCGASSRLPGHFKEYDLFRK